MALNEIKSRVENIFFRLADKDIQCCCYTIIHCKIELYVFIHCK